VTEEIFDDLRSVYHSVTDRQPELRLLALLAYTVPRWYTMRRVAKNQCLLFEGNIAAGAWGAIPTKRRPRTVRPCRT